MFFFMHAQLSYFLKASWARQVEERVYSCILYVWEKSAHMVEIIGCTNFLQKIKYMFWSEANINECFIQISFS